MTLFFANDSSVDAYVSLVWPTSSCGPFTQFRKQGWWRVNSKQSVNVWAIDLRKAYAPPGSFPFGGFYAEEFANGGGNTWEGFLGQSQALINGAASFNQCFDDLSNCNLTVDMGILPFNAASGMTVRLLDKLPEEPNWEVIVFDEPQFP
jgi:hypothetical protein